jgi:hypothetical protein
MSLFGLTEAGKVLVFAFAYKLAILFAAPIVFENLEPVEPVFNVAVLRELCVPNSIDRLR